MEKESLHDSIEAYLDGTLPEKERRAFEQAMAADPALAAEVALHRWLEEFLAAGEKLALRQKLDEIAMDFPAPGSPGLPRWLRWAGAIALVFVLTVAAWRYAGWKTETAVENPVQSPGAIEQAPSGEQGLFPGRDTVDTPRAQNPEPGNQVEKKTVDPFATVPLLEKEITAKAIAQYAVDSITLDLQPAETGGQFELLMLGRMLTALAPPELELTLLDNVLPAGKPVGKITVARKLDEAGEPIVAFAAKERYQLSAFAIIPLEKGLYYARITAKGEKTSLWTGKFTIGK